MDPRTVMSHHIYPTPYSAIYPFPALQPQTFTVCAIKTGFPEDDEDPDPDDFEDEVDAVDADLDDAVESDPTETETLYRSVILMVELLERG